MNNRERFSIPFSIFCVVAAGYVIATDDGLVKAGIALGFGGAIGIYIIVGIGDLLDTIEEWWKGRNE